ncbi:MAG: hypothetical protein OXF29_03090 [Hyphomicrobiales bacterium]|nr:hypothetical protein [Hyphomicrobiales bacterium]
MRALKGGIMSKYIVLNLDDPIDKQLLQLAASAVICGCFGLIVIPFIIDLYKTFIG